MHTQNNGPPNIVMLQGPLPSTVGDFWRMVIEHDIKLIIMVTNLVEHNKVGI